MRVYTVEANRERVRKWRAEHPQRAQELNRRSELNRKRKPVNKEPKGAYYLAHREEMKLNTRLKQYDLTPDEFFEMEKRADGKCEICKQENDRLQIDHHHGSRIVRGLICQSCNIRVDHVEHGRWIIPCFRPAIERYLEFHLTKARSTFGPISRKLS